MPLPLPHHLTDPKNRFWLGIMAIVFVTLLGLLFIMLILIAWRRYNERLSRPTRPHDDAPTDAWSIAGQRLDTPPPPESEETDQPPEPDNDQQ